MRLEFVFDYASPYAYLANSQLAGLGTAVDYQPLAIVEVMRMVNNQPSPACPPKARYSGLDAGRWARHYGVPLSINPSFFAALRSGELDGTLLSRGALAAQDLGVFDGYNAAIFNATWGEPGDVATPAGRAALLEAAGVDPAPVWARAEDEDIRALLAQRNEAAAARGVFGVPTFFVDDEMFFGNDRLDFVRSRIAEAKTMGAMA